jgi:hypothetical protein
MIGGTPRSRAIRVSPAPWIALKSSCFRSVPTTFTSAPRDRNSVLYAFAAPSCPILNVSTHRLNWSGFIVPSGSRVTT